METSVPYRLYLVGSFPKKKHIYWQDDTRKSFCHCLPPAPRRRRRISLVRFPSSLARQLRSIVCTILQENPLVNFILLWATRSPEKQGNGEDDDDGVTLRSHNQIEELKVECATREGWKWERDSTQVHIENLLLPVYGRLPG